MSLNTQHISLVKNWLHSLEKKKEDYSEGWHTNHRIFLSAELLKSVLTNSSILEASIKITNEPPTGMQANLHKALDNFDQVGKKDGEQPGNPH
jgi:dynein heavy chain